MAAFVYQPDVTTMVQPIFESALTGLSSAGLSFTGGFALSTQQSTKGRQSVQITAGSGTGAGFHYALRAVNTGRYQPFTKYIVTADLYMESATNVALGNMVWSYGVFNGSQAINTALIGSWQTVTMTFTTGADTSGSSYLDLARIQNTTGLTSSFVLYVDNVNITAAPIPNHRVSLPGAVPAGNATGDGVGPTLSFSLSGTAGTSTASVVGPGAYLVIPETAASATTVDTTGLISELLIEQAGNATASAVGPNIFQTSQDITLTSTAGTATASAVGPTLTATMPEVSGNATATSSGAVDTGSVVITPGAATASGTAGVVTALLAMSSGNATGNSITDTIEARILAAVANADAPITNPFLPATQFNGQPNAGLATANSTLHLITVTLPEIAGLSTGNGTSGTISVLVHSYPIAPGGASEKFYILKGHVRFRVGKGILV
jgi:hypothetical protein